jgi:hypothetical protein
VTNREQRYANEGDTCEESDHVDLLTNPHSHPDAADFVNIVRLPLVKLAHGVRNDMLASLFRPGDFWPEL